MARSYAWAAAVVPGALIVVAWVWSWPWQWQVPDADDSCRGRCGSWAKNCWCNDECGRHGNCCSDFRQVCQACEPCPRSTFNCDEWIKWDPSRYTCESLTRDWGCDCGGCASCDAAPTPPRSPVRSNEASLRLFSTSRYPQARCLDGSMAGYYFREGSAKQYLIFLEGGGWCYDSDCAQPTQAGTLRDCRQRSRTRLGSSGRWPNTQDQYLTGMLSSDPGKNPAFHSWTLVYVPYCDGASFSGDKELDGLHFRGRAILRALVDDLRAQTNIADADQVVLAGGSAGASAVYYHIDALAERLALTSGEVLGIADAGFFLDLPDSDGVDCWPAQMRSLFDLLGYEEDDLHAGCLARFQGDLRWKCLFPENFADLIKAPLFAFNSFYDSSEMTYTLRLHCCPGGCAGRQPTCSRKQLQQFSAMREEHMKAWAPFAQKNRSGVWAPSCIAHTMAWDKWTDPSWEVPAGSGNTMAAVVSRWLAGEDDGSHFVYQDAVPWPHHPACAGGA